MTMTADQINTNLLQADIEAANKPADIEWLRAELATAQARLAAGFEADNAPTDFEDAFADFDLGEDAWLSMINSKIAAYERAIATHPDA